MAEIAVTKQETRIIPEEVPPKFFAEHLKPFEFVLPYVIGKNILEVGCGDGYGSAFLAKKATKVTGIDYEEDIVLQARNKYREPNLTFMRMDATNLQFKNGSFDIVCSFQVIEHIPEEQILLYLSEIKRVLRDNGKIFLSTLNLGHTMKSSLTYKKNPAHCKEFVLRELKDLLLGKFSNVEIYGLHLTLKHNFYQRLKKIGIFNYFPDVINPVSRFYKKVTTKDFKINSDNLEKAIDFICVCTKASVKRLGNRGRFCFFARFIILHRLPPQRLADKRSLNKRGRFYFFKRIPNSCLFLSCLGFKQKQNSLFENPNRGIYTKSSCPNRLYDN